MGENIYYRVADDRMEYGWLIGAIFVMASAAIAAIAFHRQRALR